MEHQRISPQVTHLLWPGYMSFEYQVCILVTIRAPCPSSVDSPISDKLLLHQCLGPAATVSLVPAWILEKEFVKPSYRSTSTHAPIRPRSIHIIRSRVDPSMAKQGHVATGMPT